ncbi:MAG: hypothetical protein JSW70_05545 [Syntrophobacterales bacterium]|nr:MAG: hypothetical protein JSW70_05545 [Syntrophobacterales bacterium]
MPKMFLVKDGPPPNNVGPAKQIKLSELYEYNPDLEAKWLGTELPVFKRESPSMYPQHIVIQVEASEVDDRQFRKEGFHLLISLSPQEPGFRRRFH